MASDFTPTETRGFSFILRIMGYGLNQTRSNTYGRPGPCVKVVPYGKMAPAASFCRRARGPRGDSSAVGALLPCASAMPWGKYFPWGRDPSQVRPYFQPLFLSLI